MFFFPNLIKLQSSVEYLIISNQIEYGIITNDPKKTDLIQSAAVFVCVIVVMNLIPSLQLSCSALSISAIWIQHSTTHHSYTFKTTFDIITKPAQRFCRFEDTAKCKYMKNHATSQWTQVMRLMLWRGLLYGG